jgi:acetyl esterase/lipase
MLSVDYRLAPEHRYPTQVQDAYASLRWLDEHAKELGVDRERIAVMGESAGGGLAAAVAIMTRDHAGPAIARQILIYPMLDDRTTTIDAHIVRHVLWKYDDNVTGWGALLGNAAGGPDVPATAAPARITDPAELPSAYIEVGQLDIIRDEDLTYALRLGRAGVEVEFHLRPGVPHTFEMLAPASDVARRAIAGRVASRPPSDRHSPAGRARGLVRAPNPCSGRGCWTRRPVLPYPYSQQRPSPVPPATSWIKGRASTNLAYPPCRRRCPG